MLFCRSFALTELLPASSFNNDTQRTLHVWRKCFRLSLDIHKLGAVRYPPEATSFDQFTSCVSVCRRWGESPRVCWRIASMVDGTLRSTRIVDIIEWLHTNPSLGTGASAVCQISDLDLEMASYIKNYTALQTIIVNALTVDSITSWVYRYSLVNNKLWLL